jgi:hypothetical protein
MPTHFVRSSFARRRTISISAAPNILEGDDNISIGSPGFFLSRQTSKLPELTRCVSVDLIGIPGLGTSKLDVLLASADLSHSTGQRFSAVAGSGGI